MLPAVNKNNAAAVKKGALARAINRFAAWQEEWRRAPRIGFLIDATASRRETWEQAQAIQAGMFRAVAELNALSLRLIHFGGDEVRDHGWISWPRAVAAAMAGVACKAGRTQILPALTVFLDEADGHRAGAIILTGDRFEEDAEEANALARALKGAGIRVFSFLEGEDMIAECVFRRLAEQTGGKFAKFGSDLPLADLCEGVALLAAGGEKAAARIGNKKVRQLLLPGPSERR